MNGKPKTPLQPSSKANGLKGSRSAHAPFRLPPVIDKQTLSTLYRIPIASDTKLSWTVYKSVAGEGDDSAHTLESVVLALRELNLVESTSENRGRDIELADGLRRYTLWTPSEDQASGGPIQSTIFLFTLANDDEQTAESSMAANSESRVAIDQCRTALQQIVDSPSLTKKSGQCQLHDFYSTDSVAPREDLSQILKLFLRSVQEHYLMRWIRNPSPALRPAGKVQPRSPRSEAARVDGEDDEEEGALEDGEVGKQDAGIKSSPPQYWNRHQKEPSYSLVRFKDGMLLFPDDEDGAYTDEEDAAPFALSDTSAPLCIGLRCFLDDQGHIYLESRPMVNQGWSRVPPDLAGTQTGLLAPFGLEVTLFASDDISTSLEDLHPQSPMAQSMGKLIHLLKLHGVIVDSRKTAWTTCTTREGTVILWPKALCILSSVARQEPAIEMTPSRYSYGISARPVMDTADRAKRLVQEAIGTLPASDTITDAGPGYEIEAEESSEDEAEDDVLAADEVADESESLQNEDSVSQDEQSMPPPKAEIKRSDEDLSKIGVPADELKRMATTKDEEETDLWETFGFEPSQTIPANGHEIAARRGSLAELDDGAYNFITEDDFAFFDDASKAQFALDDEMVDLKAHSTQPEPWENTDGDTTMLAASEDLHSEVNNSVSTYVDPPSPPGFTPGSGSTVSAAMYGLSAKTPRTPYTPNQEGGEADVVIDGGEDDGATPRYGSDMMPADHNDENGKAFEYVAARRPHHLPLEERGWPRDRMVDLSSKYGQGKFAMPWPTENETTSRAGRGIDWRDDERSEEILSRHRLQRRNRGDETTSPGNLLRPQKPQIIRSSEAGFDGAASEQSSAMEEDDDDDVDSSNDDFSHDDETMQSEYLSMFAASMRLLESYKGQSLDFVEQHGTAQASTSEKSASRLRGEIDLPGVLNLLADSPHLRSSCLSPRQDPASLFSKAQSLALFSPLPGYAEEKHLANLFAKPWNGKAVHKQRQADIVIGHQSSLVSMHASALPYWEQLGLSSCSSGKHIVSIVLHPSTLPQAYQEQIIAWISSVNSAFSTLGLGHHQMAEDGILALGQSKTRSIGRILAEMARHDEQWADTMESLLSRIREHLVQQRYVVIYAIGCGRNDSSSVSAFAKLQDDLRELAKRRWDAPADLINVRPYSLRTVAITSGITACPDPLCNVKLLARTIYDSLRVPYRASYKKQSYLPFMSSPYISILQPCFSIAPIQHLHRDKTSFQLAKDADGLNQNDAGLLLHLAYHVAVDDSDISIVSIVDERAQGQHVGGWRHKGDLLPELESVRQELVRYIKMTCIRWRVVICKSTSMPLQELKLWQSLLHDLSKRGKVIDITLACHDSLTPMVLLLPRSVASKQYSAVQDDSRSLSKSAVDASYAIHLPFRIAMLGLEDSLLPLRSCLHVSFANSYNGSVSIPTSTSLGQDSSTSSQSWLHLLHVHRPTPPPHADLDLATRLDAISGSFHELALISQQRSLIPHWYNLPWHLAIIYSLLDVVKDW